MHYSSEGRGTERSSAKREKKDVGEETKGNPVGESRWLVRSFQQIFLMPKPFYAYGVRQRDERGFVYCCLLKKKRGGKPKKMIRIDLE